MISSAESKQIEARPSDEDIGVVAAVDATLKAAVAIQKNIRGALSRRKSVVHNPFALLSVASPVRVSTSSPTRRANAPPSAIDRAYFAATTGGRKQSNSIHINATTTTSNASGGGSNSNSMSNAAQVVSASSLSQSSNAHVITTTTTTAPPNSIVTVSSNQSINTNFSSTNSALVSVSASAASRTSPTRRPSPVKRSVDAVGNSGSLPEFSTSTNSYNRPVIGPAILSPTRSNVRSASTNRPGHNMRTTATTATPTTIRATAADDDDVLQQQQRQQQRSLNKSSSTIMTNDLLPNSSKTSSAVATRYCV